VTGLERIPADEFARRHGDRSMPAGAEAEGDRSADGRPGNPGTPSGRTAAESNLRTTVRKRVSDAHKLDRDRVGAHAPLTGNLESNCVRETKRRLRHGGCRLAPGYEVRDEEEACKRQLSERGPLPAPSSDQPS